MKGKCFDPNLKVVIRKYEYNNTIDEFSLCRQHSIDPDFDGFVSETKIKEVLQN